MSDGFATPNPADVPDDDDVEVVDDGDVDADHLAEVAFSGSDVSCRNCVHAQVCAYRDGVGSMLEGRDGNPFDADDLAAICDAFETPDE